MVDNGQNMGANPGSHASTEPASRLRPPGFDPERVKAVGFVQPTVAIESVDAAGLCTGDKYIWVRHEGRPHLDALLATVHYNYGYHDNATIGGVAERVAEIIAGRGPAIAIETGTAIDGAAGVVAKP